MSARRGWETFGNMVFATLRKSLKIINFRK